MILNFLASLTKVIILFNQIPEHLDIIETFVDQETLAKLESLNQKCINSDEIDLGLVNWFCKWIDEQDKVSPDMPEISGKVINIGFVL